MQRGVVNAQSLLTDEKIICVLLNCWGCCVKTCEGESVGVFRRVLEVGFW